MDYIYLGKILQEARNALGLKQSEIADKLGCTSANISSWERGKSKIDMDSFASLCKIYNIDFANTLNKVANEQKAPIIIDKSNDDKQKLLHNYESLNNTGKNKLLEYSDDLVASGKYSDTVTIAEVARTDDNRKSLNKKQASAEELKIFDIAPQSDEEL